MLAKYKKIVIIDDSELDRFVLRHLLERKKLGEEIIATSSAMQALDALQPIIKEVKANNAEYRDICIFLDLSMPYMDGKGFLDSLKKISPELVEQVHVVSNLPFAEQKAMMEDFSLKSYFKKPLLETDLENLL